MTRAVLAATRIATLTVLGAGGCTGKYVRETSQEKIEATPERLARGSYLVNQVAGCGACHTPRTGSHTLGPERGDAFLAGGHVHEADGDIELRLVDPNITSDMETGIGKWSDDEIMRAIRDGIGRDGKLLAPIMPIDSYQHMSDEDVRAVVAYLRTVPPIKNQVDRSQNDLPFMFGLAMKMGAMHHPPARDVAMPPRQDPLRWGQYVAHLCDCTGCHSMTAKGPDHSRELAGGFVFESNELGRVPASNLTPDAETGLGRYTADQIKMALRTARRLDGTPMAPPMSMVIPHIMGLTEEDMDALVAYLKSTKPIKNAVPARELTAKAKQALGMDKPAAAPDVATAAAPAP